MDCLVLILLIITASMIFASIMLDVFKFKMRSKVYEMTENYIFLMIMTCICLILLIVISHATVAQ